MKNHLPDLPRTDITGFLQPWGDVVTYTALTPEVSPRQYFRLEFSDTTYKILCFDPEFSLKTGDFLELAEFFGQNNITVPQIFASDARQKLLLQEDCGEEINTLKDEQYWQALQNCSQQLLHLHKIQAHPKIQSRSFDLNKLMSEMEMTYSYFEKAKQMFQLRSSISVEFQEFVENTCRFLSNYTPLVICHRDYHSRNILQKETGELVWIDFQDAMLGTPLYDFVSLVFDSYRPLSLYKREDLYKKFLQSSPYANNRFRECYVLQAFQRSFKALGTYLKMALEKKADKYRESILYCLANLKEITQIGFLPDEEFLFFELLSTELHEKL
ncbi:MAG: phosphotransferase [Spirochaetota bacterium]